MKYPLVQLIPYLAQYKRRLCVGFLMVVLTVVTGLINPQILKYVVNDLLSGIKMDNLLF